jgi:hypothetical protein
VPAHQLERDGAGAGGDVEDAVGGTNVDARDEEAPPARILAQREQRRVAVVRRSERREERLRVDCASLCRVLSDDLERIAGAAAAHGPVTAVLAAEPALTAARVYLVSFGEDEAREWLVFDETGRPVDRRETVRDTASIVVMCELAAELAGGGDLEALRARLAELAVVEQPAGIDVAREAALALERTIGAPPQVASVAYLDAIGDATRRLELALGELESPFAAAVASTAGAVDAFVREVEERYKLPLR